MKIRILITFMLFLFGTLIIINVSQFGKLKQHAKDKKFPRIESTYKDLFIKFDSTKLVPSYTYYSNSNRYPIASYKLDNKYNLIIYKLSMSHEENIPLMQLFSLSSISYDSTNTEGIIYDGSYKTNYIRFLTATNSIKAKKKLNIFYNGKMTTKPFVTDSTVSYSINASNLIGKYDKTNFIDFCIEKRKILGNFSIELTLCERKNSTYLLLTLPINNDIITEHPQILNYLINHD